MNEPDRIVFVDALRGYALMGLFPSMTMYIMQSVLFVPFFYGTLEWLWHTMTLT